jgi:hypothetical protein
VVCHFWLSLHVVIRAAVRLPRRSYDPSRSALKLWPSHSVRRRVTLPRLRAQTWPGGARKGRFR